MHHRLITVVIPVYNSDPSLLSRALDSISEQTIGTHMQQTIVVDDGSRDPDTLSLLSSLENQDAYNGMPLRIIRHQHNQWLARARVTGARNTDTPFILFLDSDDYISRDYLKKAVLLLVSNPGCSWVYPHTQCFGDHQEARPPAPFNPFEFFLRNRNPYASVYRRDAWLEVPQRDRKVVDNIRFFEDWDSIIRLMARGHFGLPLADSTFYYCKRPLSLNNRTAKVYLLSIYTTWRSNILRLPLIGRSYLRHKRAQRKGKGFSSIFNPLRIVDRLQRSLFQRALEMPGFDAVLDGKSLLAGLAGPRYFAHRFLDPEKSITLAEIRCGFVRKPVLPPKIDRTILGESNPHSVLFAHTWWTIGGAETVLREWMDAAGIAGVGRILDATQLSDEENEEVRSEFAALSDEQYCLNRIGSTPAERLLFCWNLISHERPKVMVISGNAFMYALTPYIKREFPDILIVDILHNEWKNRIDWFNVAQEYQEHIDYRVVISNHWRDTLIRKYSEAPEKIRVHKNFVDTDRFAPPADPYRSRKALGLDTKGRVISFIGRLHEQKDPHVFCELARLSQDHSEYTFLVVGDGPLRDELHEAYNHLPNLTFCGESLQVEQYLAASDLVVYCSRYEGSPLGSLEAAAMNVPVIAPDIVGFREQIGEGEFGMLYEPSGEPHADARHIRNIIGSHLDELSMLGRRARDFVLVRHSRKALKDQQVNCVRELLGYPRATCLARLSRTKPRLHLHIGWTKTGSTTIQHFLYFNNHRLQDLDIFYPTQMVWGYAHHVLARFFTGEEMPEHIRERFHTRDVFEDRVTRHLADLSHAPYGQTVLSSETFRLAKPKVLSRFLSDFNVKIIIFLRRQDEWIEASANQNAKMQSKHFMALHDPRKRDRFVRRVANYYSKLEEWSSAFGRENITVVPYESSNFSQGLERHFMSLLQAEWSDELQTVGRKNQRLSRDCLAFINEYPEKVRSRNPRFHRIIGELEAYSRENPDPAEFKYILPPQVRSDIVKGSRETNKLIAAQYLGNGSDTLFTEPEPSPSDPWAPYPGLTDEKRSAIRDFLLQRGAPA